VTARAARIVCLEGPSAVGKTTLAAALARELGAEVVPELDATGAPPPAEAAAWFVERHAAQWAAARAIAATAPLVVLDGDPFKGLWYDWVFAADGWPAPDVVAPLYHAQVTRGTLAFPDLYVLLEATEAQLRARRAGDPTRTRRGFEAHLRLVAPQRRYFAALAAVAPARVLRLDTREPAGLVAAVGDAIARLPREAPDAVRLLQAATRFVTTHAPDDA
jgi:DNA polymerase III delta prime subunit